VKKRLWAVPQPVSDYLSTIRESKTCVAVLENGTTVIHRQTVGSTTDNDYYVQDGWLIEESFPRYKAQARVQAKKDTLARVENERKRRAEAAQQAARESTPAFKRLVHDLTAKLGTPEHYERGRATMLHAFPAPSSAHDRLRWFVRAREAGAAMTQWHDDELVLLAGSMAELARHTLFYGPWTTVAAMRALDALDRDAGMQLVAVRSTYFELTLARVPTRLDHHAARLGTIFDAEPAEVARALARRRWRHRVPG